MPYLKFTTNLSIDSAQLAQDLKLLSENIATILGKPEQYVMIDVQHNPNMLFAGTNDNMAYIEFKSLGLPEAQTAELSKQICTLINDHFGIDSQRIYIEFSSPERHMWGWNDRTFDTPQ